MPHPKKPKIRPNTFAAWEIALRVHAQPIIGQKKLEKIRPDDVDQLYAELKKKGAGGRSVQVVAQIMRLAFDTAIKREKYFVQTHSALLTHRRIKQRRQEPSIATRSNGSSRRRPRA